jgi:glutaredoxin-related protein
MEKLVDSIKFRYDLFQKAKGEGYDFKQSTACAIAGEYDATAVLEEVEDIIKSYPCVMFSWESSPSCKKAVDAFEKVGAGVKIVRLDDPWDEGNPIRAEIGKMAEKSCVPIIFIDGEYVAAIKLQYTTNISCTLLKYMDHLVGPRRQMQVLRCFLVCDFTHPIGHV